MKSVNNIFSEWLLASRYRTARYVISISILTVMFISILMDNIHIFTMDGIHYKAIGGFLYFLAVFGLVAVNIFVLVPRYLLKNRPAAYFLRLLTLTVVMLILLALLHFYVRTWGDVAHDMVIPIFVNFISSVCALGFLLAGTSTVLLLRHWVKTNRRINELESITLQSELEMLRNQINPHFLLNMLNNANVLIWKNKEEARRVLHKLEAMLKYQLNESYKEEVSLISEIVFLEDYLNLEKIRRDAFEFEIKKEGDRDDVFVSPLLFITFVENAVKHNHDSKKESYVHITFKVTENELCFRCENSKPTKKTTYQKLHQEVRREPHQTTGGLGLQNIRRRLTLLYADSHKLEIKDEETKYVVELMIKI